MRIANPQKSDEILFSEPAPRVLADTAVFSTQRRASQELVAHFLTLARRRKYGPSEKRARESDDYEEACNQRAIEIKKFNSWRRRTEY